MTDLSALDSARALGPIVNALGGKWMLDGDVLAGGVAAGYPDGFTYYVAGRGGVLGDVDADVITAAFGYFPSAMVRQLWETGVAVEGARAAARRYGTACADFGRSRLANVPSVGRLAELLGRVADAADPSGLALFAGWRCESRPSDDAGRAYLLLHVMRELRGSVHIVATTAAGLTPLEAILSQGGSSASSARMFGWPEPYPDVTGLVEKRRQAENTTDELMAAHLSVLDGAERAELVRLVGDAAAATS